MKEKRTFNVIWTFIVVMCVILGAIGTSIYSKRNIPSSNSKISFDFDMNDWEYDSQNNVYYKMGVEYCENSKKEENEKFEIYVPGEYLIGKKNEDGKYNCEINKKGIKSGYTPESSPMIIAVQGEENVEQKLHENYNYEEISNFINEGYIYIWPGTRGNAISNPENNEEYSKGIINGITDLKALIKFCRFNKDIMPGNEEKIISYGINGGGTKSAILGASGDSDLYYQKLATIGAISENNEGKRISDSVNGVMCCSPIIDIDTIEKEYAWFTGQYINNENKEEIDDLAIQYAEYINNLKLKDENGSLLFLEETEKGIYTEGTYINYIMSNYENSINKFIKGTSFPYTNNEKSITYNTAKDYIDSLNSKNNYILYDENLNITKIRNLKEFGLHFEKNNMNNKISQNLYNPVYFLSNKYNGNGTSYISRHWNIFNIINENDLNDFSTMNLKLLLQKNEDVNKINYNDVWGRDYTKEEIKNMEFENLKSWIKSW